jgi:hypothetical protein
MDSYTMFSGTPDDLKAMLCSVIEPLTERIRELEIIAGTRKHAYTTAEVAEQIGYKVPTVLGFIHTGKKARNGKMIKLKHKEITNGDYRILPADLDSFLAHF